MYKKHGTLYKKHGKLYKKHDDLYIKSTVHGIKNTGHCIKTQDIVKKKHGSLYVFGISSLHRLLGNIKKDG